MTCSRVWLEPHQPLPLAAVVVVMLSGAGGDCGGKALWVKGLHRGPV